jgi:hypothetical protein
VQKAWNPASQIITLNTVASNIYWTRKESNLFCSMVLFAFVIKLSQTLALKLPFYGIQHNQNTHQSADQANPLYPDF